MAIHGTADGLPAENAADDEARALFHSGDFANAMGRRHWVGLNKALRWFREEGVEFQRPSDDLPAFELIMALAFASQSLVDDLGERASEKLQFATAFIVALAELRQAVRGWPPLASDPTMPAKVSEVILKAAMVGQAETLMISLERGWFADVASATSALQEVEGLRAKATDLDRDRERRRAGAEKTNSRRARAKQRVLNEATRIASINPTLSNEDLGIKSTDAAGLKVTNRTASDWVAAWRRDGILAVRKQT
jgi:hypothetical protein